jgi:hypothetical protein
MIIKFILVHPSFTKLITSLRPAVENGEGVLDKEATSHSDGSHISVNQIYSLVVSHIIRCRTSELFAL